MTLEQILKEGEKIYNDNRAELERDYQGQYIVIDAEEKKYVINPDQLVAIDQAKKEFGDKLFYIARVGNVALPNWNFRNHAPSWVF